MRNATHFSDPYAQRYAFLQRVKKAAIVPQTVYGLSGKLTSWFHAAVRLIESVFTRFCTTFKQAASCSHASVLANSKCNRARRHSRDVSKSRKLTVRFHAAVREFKTFMRFRTTFNFGSSKQIHAFFTHLLLAKCKAQSKVNIVVPCCHKTN
jgi:hypothetical protein